MDDHFAEQFHAIAPYYDQVMSVVPYRHWVQYLRRLCKRYGWRPVTVLDVATGTGTVALMLAAEGYRVTGVDISPEMIDRAREKARATGVHTVDFAVQDATRLALPQEFDLGISLFDSLNYILSTHGLRQAFAGIFRAVKPGGGFIFDLNSEFALEHNLFTQDNDWDNNAEIKHTWSARYNARTRVATVEMEFRLADGRVFYETHKQRAHRHVDVMRFLREAGFELLDAFEAYTFLPPGRRTDRIYYIARRP